MNTKTSMKKILIVLLFFGIWKSEAQIYQKKQSVVQLGLAVNSIWYYNQDYLSNFSIPPLFALKYEYAISEHWGIGISSTYCGFTRKPGLVMIPRDFENKFPVSYEYSNKYQSSSGSFVPKVQYHQTLGNVLDGYVGVGLGLRWSYDEFSKNNVEKIVYKDLWTTMELNLGLRVKISRHCQAFGEIGFGPSAFSAGLLYRIPPK